MPPKKQTSEPKLLLGRPGNNLKIGIVGLPNVGKSTFFNALTNSSVAAENYPFCTIDPEESRVAVPDERFDWLCESFKPASKVPAVLTITDIAGLVKGASGGAGLGNAFLSHIRAVDGIFQMVRAFSDTEITHVEGEVDPVRDLEIIHEELRLKDSEFLSKTLEGLEAAMKRQGQKNADKNKVFKFVFLNDRLLNWKLSGKCTKWSAKRTKMFDLETGTTERYYYYLFRFKFSRWKSLMVYNY
jgi:obg-like ATPase 1